MIEYNSKDLERILTKIDADNHLLTPDKWTKFEYKFVSYSNFFFLRKDEEQKEKKWRIKTWKFAHSYLGNASRNFLQFDV